MRTRSAVANQQWIIFAIPAGVIFVLVVSALVIVAVRPHKPQQVKATPAPMARREIEPSAPAEITPPAPAPTPAPAPVTPSVTSTPPSTPTDSSATNSLL